MVLVLAGCGLSAGRPGVDQGQVEGSTASAHDRGEAEVVREVVEVTLTARNFTFGQEEIRVSVGDTVRVTINDAQGTHDFVIDELRVKTGIIASGGSETVEFVAEKAGSYNYYCSVGNHRKLGMEGVLIVE